MLMSHAASSGGHSPAIFYWHARVFMSRESKVGTNEAVMLALPAPVQSAHPHVPDPLSQVRVCSNWLFKANTGAHAG
jgi:hypothetical protein